MHDPTKIAILVPSLDGGGAEKVALNLCVGFAARGIHTTLLVSQAKGEFMDAVPDHIQVINLQSRSPEFIFKTLKLKQYLNRENPEILLSLLDVMGSAIVAARLSTGNTRAVLSVQTHLGRQFKDRHGRLATWLRSRIIRSIYPHADGLIAASGGVADDLSQRSGIKRECIQVIYNPVISSDFAEKAAEAVDHPWLSDGQPPVILGVGRLVKQKDFATLIKAFSIVSTQTNARLMILGSPDPREPSILPELETLAENSGARDRIDFISFRPNPFAYMAKARVFALSSIYEGFGNVVAEALACGTAVVSTDCESGPAEILDHGQFGMLVPPKNPDAMASAIMRTLEKDLDPERLKERAQLFSLESIAMQYSEAFQGSKRVRDTSREY
jgi:glycosyltransferase involved in cell wall biosynthesis